MRKAVSLALALFTAAILTSGCERLSNRIARDGALVGSYPGNWIVVRTSGSQIVDVYKLENVFVQSEENSDGWLFVDKDNNAFNISGDTKAIRITDKSSQLWNQYVEYHQEFEEGRSYFDKINPQKKQS